MHRTLSTGPSTIAALLAASRPGPAPARDTTALTTLLPALTRPRGHGRRPRDPVRPAPAVPRQ